MLMENKTGLLIKGIGGFYYVETEQGVLECKARGAFRKKGIKPMAGDGVTVQIEGESVTITEIHERKNSLIRPPLSNLDQLFLIVSVVDPAPNLFVIDKMLAVAEDKGIDPVVVFTKADLMSPEPYASIYEKAGFRVVSVSREEAEGPDRIREMLAGKMSAFIGNTGVGKSTLLNRISKEFSRETGEISQKLGRGRHTTRSVELLKLENGYVADTPGFSTVDIERYDRIPKERLADTFREFQPYLGTCRFQSCAHIGEKGCAVCAAVADGLIPKSRHDSYLAMYEEAKKVKEWQNR